MTDALRIEHSTLARVFDDRGLKDVDTEVKITTLKIMCTKKN